MRKHISTFPTGCGLDGSQRRAAGHAARLADRVGRAAIFASQAAQAFGKLVAGASGLNFPGDGRPDLLVQLQVLDVLGDIVQATKQVQWIHERRDGALSQAGGHAHPLLLADLHRHAVFDRLDVHSQRGLPAGARPLAGCDLHGEMVAFAQYLCPQVALVEFCQQCLGDISGDDISVKNASFHVFDYNRFACCLGNAILVYVIPSGKLPLSVS